MTHSHTEGPGLKVVGDPTQRWYGAGYCGICGDKDVVPVAVRFWDPDDGWVRGVLCGACGGLAAPRGPHADDYACAVRAPSADAARSDAEADALGDDLDAWVVGD